MADNSIWRDIGPCEVNFDGTSLGQSAQNDGGGTQGGVRVRLIEESRESFRDKKGTNPHDSIIVGTRAEVQASLTGQSVDQLASLFGNADVIGMGGGNKRLDIKSAVGRSLRSNAKALILKPIVEGEVSTDENDWLHFDLAHPKVDIELAFSIEDQKVYNVMFMIFDNLSTGKIASIGKQTT